MYQMMLASQDRARFSSSEQIKKQLNLMLNKQTYQAGWQGCNEALIEHLDAQQIRRSSLQIVLNNQSVSTPCIALTYCSYIDGEPDQAYVSVTNPDAMNWFVDTLDDLQVRCGSCMDFTIANLVIIAYLENPAHLSGNMQWENLTELDAYLL